MPHIRLQNVCFSYPVYAMTGRSLKMQLMRAATGGAVSSGGGVVRVDALRDISLVLAPGERLGLVGHNGAGKSSLLRVLAGLAHPNKGEVDIKGRIVPLIEKGLGINPELPGRANVELPLRLLGATSKEIAHAREEIPEWTGLGPFWDLPVRTYSDGMKARLMFALSTAIGGDILLLDEWLGAGDAVFIEQAQARLTEYLNRTKIVVLSSHALDIISRICTKVAWMDQGVLRAIGDPQTVIKEYLGEAVFRSAAE